MLARGIKDALLDFQDEGLAVAREEFDRPFICLVGPEKPVTFVVSASFDGLVEDIVHTQYDAGTEIAEDALGAGAGVDVAGDDGVGVVQYAAGTVAEDDLHIGAAVADQFGVVLHIVHACELMLVGPEELAVAFEGEDIGVGVDAVLVKPVDADQFVADLV